MDIKSYFSKHNAPSEENKAPVTEDDSRFTAMYASALASNKRIYDFIDGIYEQNKFHYYRLARESEWYDNICITDNSIIRTEYARKVLGIILDGNTDILLELINKG
jgi:hypothetical protein